MREGMTKLADALSENKSLRSKLEEKWKQRRDAWKRYQDAQTAYWRIDREYRDIEQKVNKVSFRVSALRDAETRRETATIIKKK
jgi:chromosome segregation ATPase